MPSKEIALAEETAEGPAMRKLTDMQKRLVLEYLDSSGSLAECARRAGYSDPYHAGYQTMRLKKVQEALHEEAVNRMNNGAGIGIKVLREIAEDPTHKDRLKAARELIAHSGHAPIKRQEIDVRHTDNRADKVVEELKLLASQLGPDAHRLLERAKITDAIFEEVKSDLAPDGQEW